MRYDTRHEYSGTITRRRFLRLTGYALGGATLGACGLLKPSDEMDPRNAPAWMDPGTLQHAWTEVNGLTMHSLVSSGPHAANDRPVVLVHGSGLSGRYMIPTATKLTGDFRVYVPDMPGFGDSDKPEEIFDVDGLADWIAAWMPAIGLERASLLGNSFGCQVIASLAQRHPERVERAILQGPTTPPGERTWIWQFIRWRQNQRYNPKALGPVTYEDYKKCGAKRMFRSFDYQLSDRIEDRAPSIQAPTLVVRGEHDPIANQKWCELIARLCPRGSLEIIPGVAHTLCFTAPVQLAAVTRKFVAAELENSRQGAKAAKQENEKQT